MVFADAQFAAALGNSLGIAAISTMISITLAIAMFPPISVVGPVFDLWRRLGLYDTWAGLIILYTAFTLPFAIWVLAAVFHEIPWELDQAARVDGASPFQAFWRVIAPLAAPGVFSAGILVFIFAWNEFLFAAALTSTNQARTVPAAIAFFTGSSQFEQSTAAMVVTVPVILIVFLFQLRIIAGLTSGAVTA